MMTLYGLMSPVRQAQIRTALDEWRTRPGTGIRNREKTACPRGHPYDTMIQLKRGMTRRCSICFNASMQKHYARKKLRLLEPQLLIPLPPEPPA